MSDVKVKIQHLQVWWAYELALTYYESTSRATEVGSKGIEQKEAVTKTLCSVSGQCRRFDIIF